MTEWQLLRRGLSHLRKPAQQQIRLCLCAPGPAALLQGHNLTSRFLPLVLALVPPSPSRPSPPAHGAGEQSQKEPPPLQEESGFLCVKAPRRRLLERTWILLLAALA